VQDAGPAPYSPPLRLPSQLWRAALSLAVSAAVWGSIAELEWNHARWLFRVDLVLGVTAFVLSFYRRRWPLRIALALNLFGALSASSAGPAALASVSLATRRVLWQILAVGAAAMLAWLAYSFLLPPPDTEPWWLSLAMAVVVTVIMLVWGMYLGSRRELLWTLRDRADRAEAERELRFSQGRSNERARIAREMHDVLAHRITLISMHAGALAYRDDLSVPEIRAAADLIQTTSHQALTDLRQVLGVLRDDSPGAAGLLERPQPTFGDLPALIEEAEQCGMQVRYDDRVAGAETIPDPIGRTVYRIVQEGLTNARKHAPGALVTVALSGSPDDGLQIRVRNPARTPAAPPDPTETPPPAPPGPPGSGLGLIGLGERAKLAGGRLESIRSGGAFELRSWLPWAS
jgi:signal transduction histidine kinase